MSFTHSSSGNVRGAFRYVPSSILTATLLIATIASGPACAAGSGSTGDQKQTPANTDSTFRAASYKPAVLRLGFTSTMPATGTKKDAGSFLDLTLIPASGQLQGYRVDVTAQEIGLLLKELYGQLARQEPLNTSNPESPARRLYDILIRPVAAELQRTSTTTLLISADQGLQAVPYAALHDGNRYFGDTYAFSITPSIGLTLQATQQLFERQSRMAAGASRFATLSPLPLVPQELKGVTNSPSSTIGKAYLNEAFTPSTLISTSAHPDITQVHIATHAEFMPGGPSRSRLYTGTTPMSLREFAQLRQRREGKQLQLITLSACRTALGDKDSELGFAGLALQAGSRSAIGSLWYVDDAVTTAYFVLFYQYLDKGYPKAEAMQKVRQALLHDLIRVDSNRLLGPEEQVLIQDLSSDQQRRLQQGTSNPYYWSGIELTGTPW